MRNAYRGVTIAIEKYRPLNTLLFSLWKYFHAAKGLSKRQTIVESTTTIVTSEKFRLLRNDCNLFFSVMVFLPSFLICRPFSNGKSKQATTEVVPALNLVHIVDFVVGNRTGEASCLSYNQRGEGLPAHLALHLVEKVNSSAKVFKAPFANCLVLGCHKHVVATLANPFHDFSIKQSFRFGY